MDDRETIRFYRQRLPHWEVRRGVYFLTMHVRGTLPRHVIEQLNRVAREEQINQDDCLRSRAFIAWEKALHADRKADYLARPAVAEICVEAIQSREERGVWEMDEYVLMPNHIHFLFQLRSGTLKSVIESFKRWTSLRVKEAISLKGRSLWQQDWFDRFSRSVMDDERYREYIRENPVQAGLVEHYFDWPYGSWKDATIQRRKQSRGQLE